MALSENEKVDKRRAYYIANKERWREYTRRWREANPERNRELNAASRRRNSAKRAAWDREYREQNHERILTTRREYISRNRDVIRSDRQKHYTENKDRSAELSKKWRDSASEEWKAAKRKTDAEYRAANKAKIQAYFHSVEFKLAKNERARKRYAEDLGYRIEKRLRAALLQAIRLAGTNKSASVAALIGMPMAEFVKYIEAQFVDGMSWERFGEIHIDHIRPCASFDLKDPEQQRACFNHTNLRPLWGEANRAKGSNWNGQRIARRPQKQKP